MLQEIIVWIVFGGALFYLGAHFFITKKEEKDCAKGCGGCSSIDLDENRQKNIFQKNRAIQKPDDDFR